MAKGNLVLYFFPYLFIEEDIVFGGYKLKPSFKSNFDKEPNRIKAHLTRLSHIFLTSGNQNVFQYTYGSTTVHNSADWDKLRISLDKFATILRYEILSKDNSGADFTNFDYVVVELYEKIRRKDITYYNCNVNGRASFPVYYPDSRVILNPSVRPYITRVLVDSHIRTHIEYLLSNEKTRSEGQRYLRSLEWFNKSKITNPEIDGADRIINLAIAFESLFNSPEESIQANLKSILTTLLGDTEEMKHWVSSFYDTRSSIVHGSNVISIDYVGKKSSSPHLNHLLYGQKVYTRVVRAVFESRRSNCTEDLHEELISNERRLSEILPELSRIKSQTKQLYTHGVLSKISSISSKDITGNREKFIQIGRLLLPRIKYQLKKNKRSDIIAKVDEIINFNGTDSAELATLYSELQSLFSPFYYSYNNYRSNLYLLVLMGSVYNYASFMTWRLFYDKFNKR